MQVVAGNTDVCTDCSYNCCLHYSSDIPLLLQDPEMSQWSPQFMQILVFSVAISIIINEAKSRQEMSLDATEMMAQLLFSEDLWNSGSVVTLSSCVYMYTDRTSLEIWFC